MPASPARPAIAESLLVALAEAAAGVMSLSGAEVWVDPAEVLDA